MTAFETNHAEVERREAEFWDAEARRLSDADLMTVKAGGSKPDQLRLSMCGLLAGKRVLDVGCGSGEWAALLAQRGAHVTAIDISPEMVNVTNRRAALLGLTDRLTAVEMSASRMAFPDGQFDVVHGQDIIHHLEPTAFGAEIARVLTPGGVAVFRENSANNPILMFARDVICGRFGIAKESSDDEYPLTRARLRQFGAGFSSVRVAYPEVLIFHYVDSKIFRHRIKAVSLACKLIDQTLGIIPPLRQFSYRQLVLCVR